MIILADYRDEITKAHAAGTCIVCRYGVEHRNRTEAEREEYRISAMCGVCFQHWSMDTREDYDEPQLGET